MLKVTQYSKSMITKRHFSRRKERARAGVDTQKEETKAKRF